MCWRKGARNDGSYILTAISKVEEDLDGMRRGRTG